MKKTIKHNQHIGSIIQIIPRQFGETEQANRVEDATWDQLVHQDSYRLMTYIEEKFETNFGCFYF